MFFCGFFFVRRIDLGTYLGWYGNRNEAGYMNKLPIEIAILILMAVCQTGFDGISDPPNFRPKEFSAKKIWPEP